MNKFEERQRMTQPGNFSLSEESNQYYQIMKGFDTLSKVKAILTENVTIQLFLLNIDSRGFLQMLLFWNVQWILQITIMNSLLMISWRWHFLSPKSISYCLLFSSLNLLQNYIRFNILMYFYSFFPNLEKSKVWS